MQNYLTKDGTEEIEWPKTFKEPQAWNKEKIIANLEVNIEQWSEKVFATN